MYTAWGNTNREVSDMSKDSQIDPKEVRKEKSKGSPTFANDAMDGEGKNARKQSARRDWQSKP